MQEVLRSLESLEWSSFGLIQRQVRGIEVRIRVYEPDSRQIREVSIRQSFVPE